MSADAARVWLSYAVENLELGRVALDRRLLNPALQNAQQAVEKSLKAVWVLQGEAVKKTHYIADLVEALASLGLDVGLSPQECDLLDSVYLPSKYPTGSALPDGFPTIEAARQCVEIGERTCAWAARSGRRESSDQRRCPDHQRCARHETRTAEFKRLGGWSLAHGQRGRLCLLPVGLQ
jgi:HEPN domain-containing protein